MQNSNVVFPDTDIMTESKKDYSGILNVLPMLCPRDQA